MTEKSVLPCPSRQTVTHKNLLQNRRYWHKKNATKVAAIF
ncbi:hypothetical protein HMPREF9080_02179 [Cardiobacterium valvarum F0432]|uniref:Uncharacterized protein n=1 Tax=Cardiobacterium valvarum F0432 TaxID=797473 RepID=G9ZHE5_9GAMM|nr:hypothetical protein HMPREF9080_02179 [Cardiobacterium valvarum F0432]